jgi:hypothetical protein
MNRYVIGIIAASLGALLTMIGKFIAASFSANTENKISLRDSALKRLTALEIRQDHLEEQVQKWIARYWALYRWMIKYQITNDLDISPPDFHKMTRDEVETKINEIENYE